MISKEFIVFYLPFLMSAITLYMTFMAGSKKPYAWAIGLVNQVFWFTWIIFSQAWGLLPMTIGLTIVYLRNHLKWMEPKAS